MLLLGCNLPATNPLLMSNCRPDYPQPTPASSQNLWDGLDSASLWLEVEEALIQKCLWGACDSIKVRVDMSCCWNKYTVGLPAYSDTGYSDNPATVTVIWSQKGPSYFENHRIEWQTLIVTLFRFLSTVTVTDRACSHLQCISVGLWTYIEVMWKVKSR